MLRTSAAVAAALGNDEGVLVVRPQLGAPNGKLLPLRAGWRTRSFFSDQFTSYVGSEAGFDENASGLLAAGKSSWARSVRR